MKVKPGRCVDKASGAKKARTEKCDSGDAFAVYWARKDGSRLGEPLAVVPREEPVLFLRDQAVPAGAAAIAAFVRNEHGDIYLSLSVQHIFIIYYNLQYCDMIQARCRRGPGRSSATTGA